MCIILRNALITVSQLQCASSFGKNMARSIEIDTYQILRQGLEYFTDIPSCWKTKENNSVMRPNNMIKSQELSR